jgi:hypothetical protein
MNTTTHRRFAVATSAIAIAAALLIAGCASASTVPAAPTLQARVKPMLSVDGLKFKDSNANGKLDAEIALQPLDLSRQRRLGQVQASRRATEAALLGNGDEVFELTQIHASDLQYLNGMAMVQS